MGGHEDFQMNVCKAQQKYPGELKSDLGLMRGNLRKGEGAAVLQVRLL